MRRRITNVHARTTAPSVQVLAPSPSEFWIALIIDPTFKASIHYCKSGEAALLKGNGDLTYVFRRFDDMCFYFCGAKLNGNSHKFEATVVGIPFLFENANYLNSFVSMAKKFSPLIAADRHLLLKR